MALRSLLIALLLVGGALAGCLTKDDPGDVLPQNDTGPGGINTAPPDNRTGKLVAFEETNQTEAGVGGVDHHHDLWTGRERVLLFETRAEMDGDAVAEFRVPQKTSANAPEAGLVFEGTGSVEFTISEPQRRVCETAVNYGGHPICTDTFTGQQAPDPTGGSAGLVLSYKHASTTKWIEVGVLEWGKASVIKITDPRQTDMPHSTSSLWQFMVVSPNAQDATLTFKVKADIVRGPANIPLWPGHPLFYTEGKHVREIYNGPAESVGGVGGGATGSEKAGPVYPSKLISYGTRSVYVWVNITSVNAPNPATAPTTWYLHHWNATGLSNTTNPFDNVNHSADKKEHFWILPVRDNDMDSPYQEASRWGFELRGALTTTNGGVDAIPQFSCYEGCADYVVQYTLVVKASDLDETGKYEIYCEDSEIQC